MVTRMRPLEVTMVFRDRNYKRGETVDIDLNVSARRDVVIREGRLDLMCQESYERTYRVPVRKAVRGGLARSGMVTNPGTKQVTQARNITYSHSDTVFLSETQIRSGENSMHRVRLDIGPNLPQHMEDPLAKGGEVSWSLVATFDVAQSRDVTEEQPISVDIALHQSRENARKAADAQWAKQKSKLSPNQEETKG